MIKAQKTSTLGHGKTRRIDLRWHYK